MSMRRRVTFGAMMTLKRCQPASAPVAPVSFHVIGALDVITFWLFHAAKALACAESVCMTWAESGWPEALTNARYSAWNHSEEKPGAVVGATQYAETLSTKAECACPMTEPSVVPTVMNPEVANGRSKDTQPAYGEF